MKIDIIIRTDGANHIGTGHVYRCLTLAKKLKTLYGNIDIVFAMIEFDIELIKMVQNSGFKVVILPRGSGQVLFNVESTWLSKSQQEDALIFLESVKSYNPKCCIVDHYTIDHIWEEEVAKFIPKIIVIDDLANRHHFCHMLVDQNYWPNFEYRYENLAPNDCIKLLGPSYCLLRDEFYTLRQQYFDKKGILVNFGGVGNYEVLSNFINAFQLFTNYQFTVITGKLPKDKWDDLQNICQQMKSRHVKLIENAINIAQIMAQSKFAFGACGSSVWERFCLGLNSALIEVANNQSALLDFLVEKNLIDSLGKSQSLTIEKIIQYLSDLDLDNQQYLDKKQNIMNLVDALGSSRVSNQIWEMLNVKR